MSKITKATIKSFIRKNIENLLVKQESHFDGMTDCVERIEDTFKKVDATKYDVKNSNTLGIAGVWFVGDSRDYFQEYENENIKGYRVYNCCGSFVIGVAQ